MRALRTLPVVLCLLLPAASFAQQVAFEDVVKNLASQDPKVRLASVRLLRESRYPQSAGPLAALIADPVESIQLEAIATELSFFVVDGALGRKDGALVTVPRDPANAQAVFDAGELAVWPRTAPAELLGALLRVLDDGDARVRLEALYAFGSIAPRGVDDSAARSLLKVLDHPDARMRAAAAQVVGRLHVADAADKLMQAVNDKDASVRQASMRALGDLMDARAIKPLTDQLTFSGKGEEAAAALDGLARIAQPASVPIFRQHLADKDPLLRRPAAEGIGRARDTASISALELTAGSDASASVRAAISFGLQKLGRPFIARLVEFLDNEAVASQVDRYFLELGPSILLALRPHANDPSPFIRAHVIEVMGALGTQADIPAIRALTKDANTTVARLAEEAIQRINLRH